MGREPVLPEALGRTIPTKRAAVALRPGLRLVTRNARDFDEKKQAFVLIPYQLG
jgi:hypothetical protein